MSSLRESSSYIWDLSDQLGHGACGNVYKGMKKSNGEPVAVKVFNKNAAMRPKDVQIRELEVLKNLRHECIVKVLAIEEESRASRHGKVIVMELCQGSLLKILDQPENCFGLPEDEFLKVLEHLCAGIKYLRNNKHVHRDLKPANIMKYVGDDGKSIYKLADFDSSRELGDNDQFESIFGTEEYLDPYIYEVALLPSAVQQRRKFTASTDLWSIGVTLYHIATGKLPFRPYGGRRSPRTMHEMTTKKESGVIEAYQLEENGPIFEERELPKNCHLSKALRQLITPLLAQLMEANPKKKLTYSDFFSCVDAILSRKKLHFFYFNRIKCFRVYLDIETHPHFDDLQDLLMEQTKIPPVSQIVLFKDATLFSILENGTLPTSTIPLTTEDSPILLIHSQDEDIHLPPEEKSTIKYKLFPNKIDHDTDANISRHNCSIGYVQKRQVELICRHVNLFNSAVSTINQVVMAQLTSVSKENLQIQSVVKSLNNQVEMMIGYQESCQEFLTYISAKTKDGLNLQQTVEAMKEAYKEHYDEFQSLVIRLNRLRPAIKKLLGSRVENRSLIVEWEKEYNKTPCVSNIISTTVGNCVVANISANIVAKLQESFNHLWMEEYPSTTKSGGRSNTDDQVFFLMERERMKIQCLSMDNLLKKDCRAPFIGFVNTFSDWFKLAQTALLQPEILAKDITDLKEDLLLCEVQLNQVVAEYREHMQNFTKKLALGDAAKNNSIQNGPKSPPPPPPRSGLNRNKETLKKVARTVDQLANSQKEAMAKIVEDVELRNKLQRVLIDAKAEQQNYLK